jgi:Protein of unknown function (DUF433)
MLASGMSEAEILDDYPSLEKADLVSFFRDPSLLRMSLRNRVTIERVTIEGEDSIL